MSKYVIYGRLTVLVRTVVCIAWHFFQVFSLTSLVSCMTSLFIVDLRSKAEQKIFHIDFIILIIVMYAFDSTVLRVYTLYFNVYSSCRVAPRRLRKANKTTVDSLATKQREMSYLILGRILIFVLCLKRTVCLVSSSSSSSSHPLRIVSLNKNGGNVKYFDLGSSDTTEENNANHPLRKINDKKTAYLFTVIRSTFLPNGFPVKTPPGYLRYSLWSWIQDISTQLRSVLATQRILEGVGVGSSEATALSALFNYLVRDGCGMAAGKETY
jgi:hypothetical protein